MTPPGIGSGDIAWPIGYRPADSPVAACNEAQLCAGQQQVWDWLIRAAAWPAWYRNARHVEVHGANLLELHSVFTWWTFGVNITSQVVDFDPPHHLGWQWWRVGARGHHGWRLSPGTDAHHTRVVTAETQRGVVPSLLAPVLRPMLSAGHAYWLRQLSARASGGPPPAG